MSTGGLRNIDFRDKEIITFLASDRPPQQGASITLDLSGRLSALNMEQVAVRPEPGTFGEEKIITAVERRYMVLHGGQEVGQHNLIMPVINTVDVSVATLLGVRLDSPSDVKETIKQLFLDYDPKLGTIEYYASTKAKEMNIAENAFDLFPQVTIKLKNREVLDDKERWLRELYYGDARRVAPDLGWPDRAEEANMCQRGYELRPIGESALAEYTEASSDRDLIDVPQNSTEEERVEAVKREVGRKAEENKCTNIVIPTPYRITELRLPDQNKWESEWAYVELNCGGGFHFWKAVRYDRSHYRVLYATISYLKADAAFEEIFIKSLREAAEFAAVLAIVTGSFDEGVAAFKLKFEELIEDRVTTTKECLMPNLNLTEETGAWQRVG